jgi:hydroxyquinol 1,2-dioxygenase
VQNIDEFWIAQAVPEATSECKNDRLPMVMTSLAHHLHAFHRELRLTEEELREGIQFLTAAGRITDEKRQEFILLSDVLGLSTLVTALF